MYTQCTPISTNIATFVVYGVSPWAGLSLLDSHGAQQRGGDTEGWRVDDGCTRCVAVQRKNTCVTADGKQRIGLGSIAQ